MIKLKHLLTESFTIDSITFTPKNPAGGPIIVRYRDTEHVYHVVVNTLPYDGPLAVTKMWKSVNDPDTYILRDNKGHQHALPTQSLETMARQLKAWPEKVTYLSFKIDIILNKHHD